MRAKRAKLTLLPRLEPLEARLALSAAAQLVPLADDPGRFVLTIDLSLHPHGGDGRPDTVFVSRAGGTVEVVLVGRVPEVLYQGPTDSIDSVGLLSSTDVEYVVVADDAGPALDFFAGPEDQLIWIGRPIATPAPVPAPQAFLSAPDSIAEEALPLVSNKSELSFEVGVFLGPTNTLPPAAPTEKLSRRVEQPSVPPELLGGEPKTEELDVRRLVGGSHQGDLPIDDLIVSAPEVEPDADKEPVAA